MQKLRGKDGEVVKVKLVGSDGNAFAVLGECRRAAKRAGVPNAFIEEFTAEATNGDYNHLLDVCMQAFDVE
jgi:hypothetical protein